jgi:hypothetical protein
MYIPSELTIWLQFTGLPNLKEFSLLRQEMFSFFLRSWSFSVMSFVLIFQPKTRYLNVTNFFLGRTQLGFTLFMYNLVLTEKEAIKSIFAKLIKNGKSGKTYFCHILIFAENYHLKKSLSQRAFYENLFNSFLSCRFHRVQGCQMVYFQTKNPYLGKFCRFLQWTMLIYFMSIW